ARVGCGAGRAQRDAMAAKSARNAYRRESFFVGPPPVREARWIVATICLALVVIVGGALVWRAGVLTPAEAPAVGGPVRLTDQDGRRVDEHILKGKWSLVFFGFTYCPEACPTTLATYGAALE